MTFFRFIAIGLCLWWVCRYIYRLGKNSALKGNKNKSHHRRPGSKVVKSSVVEKSAKDETTETKK